MSEEALKDLVELMDREKIRDCMMRYAQAVDRLDMEMLKSVYWPDAYDQHGPYKGNAYDVFDDIFVFLREKAMRTQHFLGASLIRFTDTHHAKVETYSQNFHSMRGDDGEPDYDFIHGGRYLDKMEKRGSEWRIISRIIMIEWVTQGAKPWDSASGILGSTDIPVSTRHPDDLMYEFFGDFANAPITGSYRTPTGDTQ